MVSWMSTSKFTELTGCSTNLSYTFDLHSWRLPANIDLCCKSWQLYFFERVNYFREVRLSYAKSLKFQTRLVFLLFLKPKLKEHTFLPQTTEGNNERFIRVLVRKGNLLLCVGRISDQLCFVPKSLRVHVRWHQERFYVLFVWPRWPVISILDGSTRL